MSEYPQPPSPVSVLPLNLADWLVFRHSQMGVHEMDLLWDTMYPAKPLRIPFPWLLVILYLVVY